MSNIEHKDVGVSSLKGTPSKKIYIKTSTEAVYNPEGVTQEYINNHVDGSKIVNGTITNSKIANGAVSMNKLDNETQTLIQRGADSSWTPMGDYDVDALYYANDLVFDPVTNSSYLSLRADNMGHAVTDETWWMKVLDGSYVNLLEEELQQLVDSISEGTQQQVEELNEALEALEAQADQSRQDIQDIVDSLAVVQTTGQSTSDVMSQKAVTDSLVGTAIAYDNSQSGLASDNVQEAIDEVVETTAINSVIDIASQYEIQFYLYDNKWHKTDQNQFSKHICVAPGQRYRITANSSYDVSLYYLHKFAPGANVSATYTRVRLDAGTTTMITIPSDMYHLVFLDNHLQSGGLFLIPDSVELVDDTSSIVVKHSADIEELESAALNEVVLGVYGNSDCTNTKKNLTITGTLIIATLEGFNVSNFIAIPSGTDYIEYKNMSANYHDELCGLLVADASNNVLWYNSVSNGILDLSDYNDAAYIRFMPLYNTSYASIRFIKREPMQGEYIGLELGAFEFSGELTTPNTRARAIIANPHNILKIKDGYGMFVFAGNENAYPTTLELIANGVSWFDSDTTDYPYLWLMVRDASGTDISLEERDLTEIVSIGGNVPQEVVRGREEIDKFVKLRSCIVDANGGGQFTTISDAVANMPDGSTILIMPGRYEESVHMWGRNLHLVGIDKESCILVNGTGNYSTPPLEANIGSISNMTIIADNYSPTIEDPTINHNSPDYCIHIEQANDSAYQFRVSNCIMNAKWNAAIGLGLRYNQTVIIEDCDIRTECVTSWSGRSNMWIEQGAIFFHNDAVATNNETGHLRVSNCRLRGLKPALSVYNVTNRPYAEVEFDNNTLISDTYGVGDGIIYRRGQTPSQGYWAGDRITLSIASHGNNISEMNA